MSQMCLSNTASCTAWETFTGTKNWILTAGEGAKTVYGWFRDSLGNSTASPITGTIYLDTTRPLDGTLTATPGPYQVQLNWSGFSDTGSGIASYRLLAAYDTYPASCFVGDFIYLGPNTSYLHTLAGNTVYYRLCAQDGAENFSTGAIATATPEQDLTPPTGSVVINGDATYATNYYVTLTISASDPSGVTAMCVSDNPSSCPSHVWEPYATSKDWYLYNSGVQTAYIWFRDTYYNINLTPFSDSIIFDWQPPTDGTLTAVPGNGTISLSWSGFSDDLSGLAGYKLVYEQGTNAYCASSPVLYQGSNTSYVHTGLTNGVWYYYRVCAADNAGNESWGVAAYALPPLSVPTGLHITGYVTRGINVSWNPNLNEAVAGYRIDYRPSWATWWNESHVGNVTTHTLTGLYRGETYVIRVRAYDGNYAVTDPSIEVSGVPGRWVGTFFDYDGDAKTDIAIYREAWGAWYIAPSGGGDVVGLGWGGGPTDIPVPADYDGDGRTDVAIYRVENGAWWIIPSSSGNAYGVGFGGGATDIPVPGDYDGDGKTDIAIYRQEWGAWYITPSGGGDVIAMGWGGGATDIPVPGDYDGDGRTDIAIYRAENGAWWIIPSSTGTAYGVGFGGGATDIPVPGDYDGDGRTDVAIYRQEWGAWYITPSDGGGVIAMGWGGGLTDIPVPGDYDGDGRTDVAIYRAENGAWWIIPSDTGISYGVGFGGGATDIPLTTNFASIY
jgi:hypothetical protein